MITEIDKKNMIIDRIENKQKKVIWYMHHSKYPIYVVTKHRLAGIVNLWIRSIIYRFKHNKRP